MQQLSIVTLLVCLLSFGCTVLSEWAPSNHLEKWYAPWGTCLVTEAANSTRHRYIDACGYNYTADPLMVASRFFTTVCGYRGTPPFAERTYLKYSYSEELDKGALDPEFHFVDRIMQRLHRHNALMVVVGDSLMDELATSMVRELVRTSWGKQVADTAHPPPLVRLSSRTHENFVRRPYNSNRTTETVLHDMAAELRKLGVNSSDIVLLINIGVHFNERHHGHSSWADTKSDFEAVVPTVLGRVKGLVEEGLSRSGCGTGSGKQPEPEGKGESERLRLHAVWVESFPTHFQTPGGYFEGRHTACVPHHEHATTSGSSSSSSTGSSPGVTAAAAHQDWRNALPDAWLSEQKSIRVLRLRDVFLPLHNMHYRGSYIDCTHYCWTPMLYQPVFRRLWDIIGDIYPDPDPHPHPHRTIINSSAAAPW